MFNLKSVKTKILIISGIPLILLLYISISGVVNKAMTLHELSKLEKYSYLAVRISSLVHETQKERGCTGGFLGSKGKKFIKELSAQRKLTDDRVKKLKEFLKTFKSNSFDPAFLKKLNIALTQLEKLESHRNKVSNSLAVNFNKRRNFILY